MNYCPFKIYKNIFGMPNTGAHSYRFLDTAIVDYISTIVGAILLTLITKIPLDITTIFLFGLGILLHILFGVKTHSTKYLGFLCN